MDVGVKDVPGRHSYSQHHIYTGTSDRGCNRLADWASKSSDAWESTDRGREHLDGKQTSSGNSQPDGSLQGRPQR
jgi:hypothetical protein